MKLTPFLLPLAVLLPLACCDCGEECTCGEPATAEQQAAHAAPHGGALIELGEHLAHVELLLDPEAGELSAWILDGEAENAVRLAQPTLTLRIDTEGGPLAVELAAVASGLTGETVGDSSQFEGTDEHLVGLESFEGALLGIAVLGSAFPEVPYAYPQGNEAQASAGEAAEH